MRAVVDVHAHLYPPQFGRSEIDAWADASAAAVRAWHAEGGRAGSGGGMPAHAVLSVPESVDDCEAIAAEAARLRERIAAVHGLPPAACGFLPCVGVHPVQPVHAAEADSGSGDVPATPGAMTNRTRCPTLADVDAIRPLLERLHADGQLAAVGECGLDFSPHVLKSARAEWPSAVSDADADTPRAVSDDEIKEAQRAVFARHIELASALGLPLNVHSRNAGHHAVTMLLASQARGVLHAFDGRASHALRAIQASSGALKLSVPACVVRSSVMQDWVRQVPLDALLIETDAPALPSVKGERNSVASYSEVVAYIARAKNVAPDVVEQITSESAGRMFPAVRAWLDACASIDPLSSGR
ncbi:hypothetical protein HK105_200480 [Polyrhizophydium stewartii]|uniref:TatD DNase family protein n=1 Tax=Polyrhizophydium stewartii TaxID=2732419 RepID=A0ABR4NJ55_9FUNG|nr:putative deoxyribonuclease tatdn3 [Polyrhizophydium stewartii]